MTTTPSDAIASLAITATATTGTATAAGTDAPAEAKITPSPMSDLELLGRLFSGGAGATPGADRVTPRAAYQLILHSRGLLVDARPRPQREREGAVADRLPVLGLDCADAVAGEVLVILAADPATAARLAEALRRAGAASVHVLDGGFPAWAAAGMPLRKRPRQASTPMAA